ncbi:MAG: glycosyltransferase [Pirellulaceae bacterium]|nr:glycosyltransferase [Pirellulaceae bacterium]
MKPFFSVIICTYNRSDLLPRALDSLLAQSESDWEAIIVDDASTDNTAEVVTKYTSACPNIRFFQRSVNRGVAAARNIGVTLSKGRYVTFLDSDDEYEVDHLAFRRRILVRDRMIQMLHGGIRIVGHPFVVDKDNPRETIHLSRCEVGGTFVIKNEVFQKIGGFDDLAYAEDSHFYETAIESGIQTYAVDHPSYIYYRNTIGQLTSQKLISLENATTDPTS